jgi:hypothetical protein
LTDEAETHNLKAARGISREQLCFYFGIKLGVQEKKNLQYFNLHSDR